MPKMGEGYLPLLYIPDGAGHYAKVPVLTTTQRDALTGIEGMVIFNATTDQLEEYDGATWEAVGQIILNTHIADLDAHTYNKLEKLVPGQYFQSTFSEQFSTADATLTADRLYCMPFVVARAMTFDRIAIKVDTLAAGAGARLGIYNSGADATPGTLLLDAGVVAVTSTGIKAITISQQLTKGLYWLACVSDGAPLVDRFYSEFSPYGLEETFSSTATAIYVAHTYGALPDPFGTPTKTTSPVPMVFLRLLSMD